MRTSRRSIVLPALAIVSLVAACSGESADSAGSSENGASSAWAPIARLVPDASDTTGPMIQAFDLEAAAAHHDLDRPGPDASIEDSTAYVMALGEAYNLPSELRRGRWDSMEAVVESFRDQLGIDVATIRRWIEWGGGADIAIILEGDFTADQVAEALRTNDWPDDLTEPGHRGITYYSWRDDFDGDITHATEFNPMGRSVRIALLDDMFVMTRGTDMMEEIIDRHLDDEPTDQLGLGTLLTRALDDERWGTMLFSAELLDSAALVVSTATESETDPDQLAEGLVIFTPTSGTSIEDLASEVQRLVDDATSTDDLQALADATTVISDDHTVTIRIDGAAIDPDTTIDIDSELMGDRGPAEVLWLMLFDYVMTADDHGVDTP